MMSPRQQSDWASVDSSRDPSHLVAKVKALAALPSAQTYKTYATDRLRLTPGNRVINVGCGLDLGHWPERVYPGGRAVGVDNSRVMLDEATRTHKGGGPPVEFVLADAQDLPFAEGAFDAALADRLLTYLRDPVRAFRELRRVTRVGGRVAVSETDWGTAVVSSPPDQDDVTDLVLDKLCRHFPDGRLGRRLPTLFRSHGFAAVNVAAHAVATTDYGFAFVNFGLQAMCDRLAAESALLPSAAIDWLGAVEQMAVRGEFCAAVTVWTVSGTKT